MSNQPYQNLNRFSSTDISVNYLHQVGVSGLGRSRLGHGVVNGDVMLLEGQRVAKVGKR